MRLVRQIFKKLSGKKQPIYVVSGLPRSGTSMMMKMIEAGGVAPFIDNIRVPDQDNPKGYYEFEPVKQLDKDNSWLPGAQGKVVKIISMLLYHLPKDLEFKVIFMRRNMHEILASQAKMLERSGKNGADISDEILSAKFDKHLTNIESWLTRHPNIEVEYISYNELLKNPQQGVEKLTAFINHRLDRAKMLEVIDPELYRQRRSS